MEQKILNLKGPILILGASGFIGANLFRMLLEYRQDVFGTCHSLPSWRLKNIPHDKIITGDLLSDKHLNRLIDQVNPKTVFNCIAYGGYSFQKDLKSIYLTNFNLTTNLLDLLFTKHVSAYIHAGSSSEYGQKAAAPQEDVLGLPNSHYAVSKSASSNLIAFFGKVRHFPCVNLRLYSVYGPYEDSSRLIPNTIIHGCKGKLPTFVDKNISRDFVFVEDVCKAFVDAAIHLHPSHYGESFNVGTGIKTTISEFATLAQEVFSITTPPLFAMQKREWDIEDWYSNPTKIKNVFGWQSTTSLKDGFLKTKDWYENLQDQESYVNSSHRTAKEPTYSIILPIYNQEKMVTSLIHTYQKHLDALNEPYELLLVVNGSHDKSYDVGLQAAWDKPNVKVFCLEMEGWGRAVKFGLKTARGKYLCYTNSARTNIEDLIVMLHYAKINHNAVIKASRIVREGFLRKLGSLLYNLENRLLLNTPIWDVNGTPKVIPRSLYDAIELISDDDLIDAELMAKCCNKNFPILEVPTKHNQRICGKSTTNIKSAFRMYTGIWRLRKL